MKRGQSALEYLVTYGWAILAIVIIAGVLWYFGIFNPSRFVGGKQCGGFSSFICQDFTVNTAGALTIVLNNDVGSTIQNVNMTTGASGWSCVPTTVSANANTTCTAIGVTSAGTAGNNYNQITVTVSYQDSASGLTHNDSGFIQGKYGE